MIRFMQTYNRKMFIEKNTVNSVQERSHNSDVKVKQERLLQCKNI